MKIIGSIIGVLLTLVLLAIVFSVAVDLSAVNEKVSGAPESISAEPSHGTGSKVYDAKTERVQDACERATSPSADRERAWKDLSRLEPGLRIGPLSRLTLRASIDGNNTEAGRTLGLLAEACTNFG